MFDTLFQISMNALLGAIIATRMEVVWIPMVHLHVRVIKAMGEMVWFAQVSTWFYLYNFGGEMYVCVFLPLKSTSKDYCALETIKKYTIHIRLET